MSVVPNANLDEALQVVVDELRDANPDRIVVYKYHFTCESGGRSLAGKQQTSRTQKVISPLPLFPQMRSSTSSRHSDNKNCKISLAGQSNSRCELLARPSYEGCVANNIAEPDTLESSEYLSQYSVSSYRR